MNNSTHDYLIAVKEVSELSGVSPHVVNIKHQELMNTLMRQWEHINQIELYKIIPEKGQFAYKKTLELLSNEAFRQISEPYMR